VLKGRYTAIVISIFAHIALLLALLFLSDKQQHQPKSIIKKAAIKSYLYRQAKPVVKVKPITPTIEAVKSAQPKEVKTQTIVTTKKKAEITKVSTAVNPQKQNISKQASQAEAPKKEVTAPHLPSPLPVSPAIRSSSLSSLPLSSHKSLARLRNSINQQLVQDAFNEHNQVRSASVMHGEQIPVPHSEVELTAKEVYKKNTSGSHAEAITKNDNGTCTIVREQILGSPVEASVSGFSCGESKFDKSFREHMEKVNKKFVRYKK